MLTFSPACCHAFVIAASLKVFLQVHAGVEVSHLVGIAIEHERFALGELADPPLTRLAPTLMRRAANSQELTGCWSTKRSLTIDLMLLKPYFHGTTSRSGAPFWLGRTSP
jgi:hypothetical protein